MSELIKIADDLYVSVRADEVNLWSGLEEDAKHAIFYFKTFWDEVLPAIRDGRPGVVQGYEDDADKMFNLTFQRGDFLLSVAGETIIRGNCDKLALRLT